MPLPRVIARLNARYTNRFIEPVVALLPGYVRVVHTGRHTGQIYRTPLYAFEADAMMLIVLTYGTSADWVQNVLAGNAWLERAGVDLPVDTAKIIGQDAAQAHLPVIVRAVLRALGITDFMLLGVSGLTETESTAGT